MSLLSKAVDLYNNGHSPVLGRMTIGDQTKKKHMSFSPGYPYTSSDLYLKNLHKYYNRDSSYYNVIALYIDKTTLIKCIDIDITDDPDSISDANNLVHIAMEANMPIDKTPSGGYHIFYKSDGSVFDNVEHKINKLSTLGIDLLEKGHLCIVEGEGYQKINYAILDPTSVPEIDPSIKASIMSMIDEYKTVPSDTRSITTTSSVSTARSYDVQTVKNLVNHIDLYEPPAIDGYDSFNDYEIYIKILTAIYNSTGGSVEGLKVAKKFSQRVADRYGEDLDRYINETHTKWNYGWKTMCDNPITIATLYKLAGLNPPLSYTINLNDYKAYITDKNMGDWIRYADYEAKWEDKQIDTTSEFYEFVYDTQKAVKYVTAIDSYVWKQRNGTLMFKHPGKFSVIMTIERKSKRYIFRNGRDNDIYHMFTGYFKKYESIEFYPGINHRFPELLNTWIGFKAKLLSDNDYIPSTIEPFIYHIVQVMCNSNDDHGTWVLDWLASLIQTPEKKHGVALVLYSNTQGTGKTTLIKFLINSIIGETHSTSCNGLNPLFEDHNTICENKILLNVEEAFTAKDKYASFKNQFKDVITGDSMSINPKGQTRYTAKNYTRFCITTNHIDSIPIDETDRRFTFIEVSSKHKDDYEYFDALHKCFNDPDFADQVFTYLSNRTITSNLYTPLVTEAKTRSISVNSDSLTQFTDHIIQSDYKYEYTNINGLLITLNFKQYKIEQTAFLEAYKHYTNLHDLRRVAIRKKKIDNSLPNNLAITRPRRLGKELIYFENITYAD